MGSWRRKGLNTKSEDCFFSSRIRHTRYWRDWSSDVCSSDLDAEVPPAAAQSPQELCVLVLAGSHDLAICRDDLGADQVVAGETMLTHQPADPASERESGDPRRCDEATRGGEAMGLRLAVELAPRQTALSADRAGLRIDLRALHR